MYNCSADASPPRLPRAPRPMEIESAEEFALSYQLKSHRSAIFDLVFQRVNDKIRVANYKEPLDDQPASQNRANGHFHLACPYYLLNPGRYRSIEAVIEHLQEHHLQPPYCPLCSQAFTKATERDDHLRVRSCLRRESPVDGISIAQKGELVGKDSVQDSVKDRWRRIVKTVFEASDSLPSLDPYLSSGVGLAVSVTRDFWDENGHRLIGECMNAGIGYTTEEADALLRYVLEDVLRKLLDQNGV
ncbi:unnamed protein product [Clonostachys rosea f. rosea IK726]|uniref:Uncharacterized protein n=1 Tax=Clonostachys rosea f. rosea IK726 TaxID=1349383 RepID=A0ACA9U869_BIOOC|nr:unnamed protein product [Clonostachys rosea f. rosea IK726]